ncbi:MAG: twin-arginine translocase TatA/TatE family subunit [Bacteroidia bacterium]
MQREIGSFAVFSILAIRIMFNTLLFLGNLGPTEVILILVVILVFFGAKRIPELARGLGKGIREFKDASREIQNEIESESKDINKTLKP